MTRIVFDPAPEEHRHPLSRHEVAAALARAGSEIPRLAARLRLVRFGCNLRTTQEGRVVERGDFFEIRLNFVPRRDRTRILSTKAPWLQGVQVSGGRVDRRAGVVVWPPGTAVTYARFLLYHELAHIAYMDRNGADRFGEGRGSREEEVFCDAWAARLNALSS